LRLALQQITWGRPSPLRAPEQRTVALGITASAGGHELSARLAKVEAAIFRNKTITFDYYTMERDEVGARRVDPYHLLFQGGQFYLLGYAHERKAIRVFRLSRIRGRISYATKAEHDFRRPADFDPRAYANRADWQLGEQQGVAEILISKRIGWLIERHFGRYGEVRHAPAGGSTATSVADGASTDRTGSVTRPSGARDPGDGSSRAGESGDGEIVFLTGYSSLRGIISWVLGLGANARLLGGEECRRELERRLELLAERHAEALPEASGRAPNGRGIRRGRASRETLVDESADRDEAAIRPERFARLVTLASILIEAGRDSKRVGIEEVCERLQLSEEELREDVAVLNVVNFGGGSYVLYAEINDQDREIEVDPEPYSDNFDRPARLLPVEAKALVAAIDLIGEHIPEGSLTSAREKIVTALGEDPLEQGLQVADSGGDDAGVARMLSAAIARHRIVELEYYKENEDELSLRKVEPYALTNGREGWYVASYDPTREGLRHFRLDRIKRVSVRDERFKPRPEVDPAAEVDGWLRTGEVQASRLARVWISPERARWAREARRVVQEHGDGAVVVELSFAGVDWLVREILKEAGDAVVLEPPDAREAVRAAVARLGESYAVPVGI
jgi:proteasome accessory factor C